MSIDDKISGRTFLVDSGADDCIFPASIEDRRLPTTQSLIGPDGRPIKSFGQRSLHLDFNGNIFIQKFWIANVSKPILGGDFFINNDLLIDLKRQRLVSYDGKMFIKAKSTTAPSNIFGIKISYPDTKNKFEAIFDEFPGIFTPNFHSNIPAKHGVEHFITTNGPLPHSKRRRLAPDKLEVAKEEFKKMEEL